MPGSPLDGHEAIRAGVARLMEKAGFETCPGYGISAKGTLGVPVAEIRSLAKQAGRSHELAAELWASGIHEARILATIVEEPARVTREQSCARSAFSAFLPFWAL